MNTAYSAMNRSTRNIFLIGFMGAGKTTAGRVLARKLNLTFCDLDETVEKELGMTINEIFSKHGEGFFRDEESKMLRSVAQRERQVVSTGGGVVLREENWEAMRGAGIVVYLKASAEVLYNRVKNKTTRPLLQVENPFENVKELLSRRIPLYEKADLIIDTENLALQDVAAEITERIGKLSLIHKRN